MRAWKSARAMAAGLMLASSAVGNQSSAVASQTAPPVQLSYTAVHDPRFLSAAAAAFLHDEDRVIGIVAGRVAKAYPAAILSQHGLVEDEAPSGPIAVTW